VVNPHVQTGPRQRRVGLFRPRCAGLRQPRPLLLGRALARSPLLRGRRVVAFEPLRRGARHPVIPPFADHQVTMRVLVAPGVDRQRVGQLLRVGQIVGKPHGQGLPLLRGQGQRQGHFHPVEQPPVGPLVLVRRLPVDGGVCLGPRGHVAGFGIDQLGGLLPPPVLRGPLDVGRRSAGATRPPPRGRADVQVVAGPATATPAATAIQIDKVLVFGSHVTMLRGGKGRREWVGPVCESKHRVSWRETLMCALSSFVVRNAGDIE